MLRVMISSINQRTCSIATVCLPLSGSQSLSVYISQSCHNSIASFWQLYLEFNIIVCHCCPQSGKLCCRCFITCCQAFNLTTNCFLLDLSFIVTHIQTLNSVWSDSQMPTFYSSKCTIIGRCTASEQSYPWTSGNLLTDKVWSYVYWILCSTHGTRCTSGKILLVLSIKRDCALYAQTTGEEDRFDVVGKTQPSILQFCARRLLSSTPQFRVWNSSCAHFGLHCMGATCTQPTLHTKCFA